MQFTHSNSLQKYKALQFPSDLTEIHSDSQPNIIKLLNLRLPQMQNIVVLIINNSQLSSLHRFPFLPNLQYINLDTNHLTNPCFTSLKPYNKTLLQLSLIDNRIDPNTVQMELSLIALNLQIPKLDSVQYQRTRSKILLEIQSLEFLDGIQRNKNHNYNLRNKN